MLCQVWRTRLPAIRTLCNISIQTPILWHEFLYQRASPQVFKLYRLGVSKKAIMRSLKIKWRTLQQALEWAELTDKK